jgi:transposase
MKALTISNQEEMILALQDEIRRSPDARYDHRLHGVLLVAEGMSCRQTAEVLGDSHGTVVNWVRRFEESGFGGLSDQEGRGRRSRLRPAQMKQVETALRRSPVDYGLPAQLWDGPLLSSFLEKQFGVTLRARQCQRMFRRLGFRLRKPRPEIAQADPLLQAAVKKTPAPGKKRKGRSVGDG